LLRVADVLAQLTLAGCREVFALEDLVARRLALLDALAQTGLVILCPQAMLADVVEIEPDQIFFFTVRLLLGHLSPQSWCHDQPAGTRTCAPLVRRGAGPVYADFHSSR